MTNGIGQKIKELRTAKGWTLKELGHKTSLSAGYLSLVERDLTSINITSLQAVADALAVEVNTFFAPPVAVSSNITRSHERPIFFTAGSNNAYFSLASNLPPEKSVLEPIIVQMKPEKDAKAGATLITHPGEEFGLILEGIVTLILENKEYELYPGDSYHILAQTPHMTANRTNRMAQVLHITTPKMFNKN